MQQHEAEERPEFRVPERKRPLPERERLRARRLMNLHTENRRSSRNFGKQRKCLKQEKQRKECALPGPPQQPHRRNRHQRCHRTGQRGQQRTAAVELLAGQRLPVECEKAVVRKHGEGVAAGENDQRNNHQHVAVARQHRRRGERQRQNRPGKITEKTDPAIAVPPPQQSRCRPVGKRRHQKHAAFDEAEERKVELHAQQYHISHHPVGADRNGRRVEDLIDDQPPIVVRISPDLHLRTATGGTP